ncbi:MAG TPA: hypothetical protein VLI94_00395 [Solirubrobacterales bacterium]|nr:hypothetical protein [Solirubrobacterales bacterium]
MARRALLLIGTLSASLAMIFASAPSASAIPSRFFGLMWSGELSQATSPSHMEVVEHSGAKYFRVTLDWGAKNNFGWWIYDSIFQHAWERDVQIIPYIYGNHNGSSQFPTEAEYGPPGSGWETWLYELVQRYGYGGSFWAGKANPLPVGAWEIWNEPNLIGNNPGGAKAQPQNYARFLKRSASALRAAQGTVPISVLFGGLISIASNGGNLSVKDFLQGASEVPETGAAFNGLSLHPYSFALKQQEAGVQGNVTGARQNLSQIFSPTKSIWITELGWPAAPDAPEDPLHERVSEQEQANLLTGTFNWIKGQAEAMNIQSLLYYNVRDLNLNRWDYRTGLRRADGTFRPSWSAFQAQTGAAPWPVIEWQSENLGGSILDDPDIASRGAGSLDIFARSSTEALQRRTFGGGVWGPFEDFGRLISSGPGAVSWGSDRIDIVTRTSNGTVEQRWFDGSTWHSHNLGGNIVGDPDIASPGPGRLHVFARGTDNALKHKWFANGVWSNWESLGGTLTSSPGAVSWGSGRLDVVGRSATGSVTHWWFDGSWHSGDDLGGNIVGDPDIAAPAAGWLHVFARGTDNALKHKWLANNTTWSGWESLGGSLASGPGAVSWGSNRLDVVARTSNGTVVQWFFDGKAWGSYNLGGNISGDPDIASWGNGRLDVFARGQDDTLQHKWFTGNTWSGWEDFGNAPQSGVSTVSWGAGRLDIVSRRASDGSVMHWWLQNGWHSGNLGGNIVGDPELATTGTGRLHVFARGTDNALKHKWFGNGVWSGWESLGGTLTSSPGAVAWGSNRLDVVGRSATGSVIHWWFDGATWHSGDDLGGIIVGDPDITSWGPGRLDVFARGTNDTLVHKWFDNNTWSSWEGLGGLMASGPGAVALGPYDIHVVSRAPGNSISHWWLGYSNYD